MFAITLNEEWAKRYIDSWRKDVVVPQGSKVQVLDVVNPNSEDVVFNCLFKERYHFRASMDDLSPLDEYGNRM